MPSALELPPWLLAGEMSESFLSDLSHAPPRCLSCRLTVGRRPFLASLPPGRFPAARLLSCRPTGARLLSCLRSTGSLTIPPRPHCSGYTHPPCLQSAGSVSTAAVLIWHPFRQTRACPRAAPLLPPPARGSSTSARARPAATPAGRERWERGRSQSDILASSLVFRSGVFTVAQSQSSDFVSLTSARPKLFVPVLLAVCRSRLVEPRSYSCLSQDQMSLKPSFTRYFCDAMRCARAGDISQAGPSLQPFC